MKKINVTVWNEREGALGAYADGIHTAIADFLTKSGEFGNVRTAILPQPEHGLTDEVLANTDVLTWWGHMFHGDVDDAIVEKVRQRVLDGMGLIVLHSGHGSKIFNKLMGTNTGSLRWREKPNELERVWKIESNHQITVGLPDYFEIPQTEMYGERFEIPAPDELIFISWYEGGEVFRSGCTFKRGKGRIFYFSPGHETFPIFNMPEVQLVIKNAIKWAAPLAYDRVETGHFPESPEDIRAGK